MTAGLVYFAGTVYWTSSVLAVFGGMPMILALVAMLLLAAYLAIYPAITAMVMAQADLAGWPVGAVLRPGGVGRDRVSPRLPVRRLSVGAAGQQPGHDAGRRAGGECARRVRTVCARRVRQRRDRVCVVEHRDGRA